MSWEEFKERHPEASYQDYLDWVEDYDDEMERQTN